MTFRLKTSDMTRLYQIKIRKGKSPTKARYEVNKLKQYIKSYGITI